jgi:hypothetical protein
MTALESIPACAQIMTNVDFRGRETVTRLLHEVRNRLLQIINAIAHFINSPNDRSGHLVKALLLDKAAN